jgi:hypothetical protein
MRKIYYFKHIVIFIICCFIFLISFLLGLQLDNSRLNEVSKEIQNLNLIYQNSKTELSYLNFLLDNDIDNNNNTNNSIKLNSCDLIKSNYLKSIGTLDLTGKKIKNYISKEREEDYELLLTLHSNLQIEYFVFSQKLNEKCNSEFKSILYFYTINEDFCENCQDQGIYLSYIKKLYQEKVLNFVFNYDLITSAKLIINQYNLSLEKLPILIIDKKKYGFKSKEELIEILNLSNSN